MPASQRRAANERQYSVILFMPFIINSAAIVLAGKFALEGLLPLRSEKEYPVTRANNKASVL